MLVASSRKKFSTNSHKNFVYSFQTLLGICFFLDRPTAFRFQLKTNYFALLYSLAPEPGSVYQMALTLTLIDLFWLNHTLNMLFQPITFTFLSKPQSSSPAYIPVLCVIL